MLTREFISPSLPILHLHDKVFNALQMMNDCHVSHLAVDDDGKYVGLVNEEGLMQAQDDTVELKVTTKNLVKEVDEHGERITDIERRQWQTINQHS